MDLRLEDLPVSGKRVLVRVDFNVPLEEGKVRDDARIRASLPTLHYLLEKGASLVLMSHLGRPKGQPDLSLSLAPVAKCLEELLGRPVLFAHDSVGPEAEALSRQLQPGQVLLLENLRFHAAESHPETDSTFAQKLAKLGDFYVNDAFGTAHRRHSSTYVVAELFATKAAMGLLMRREVDSILGMLSAPQRPFYAIIGGSKVSSKIGVLKALLPKVDGLFIGGAMAFTFLQLLGKEVGGSLVEPECSNLADEILQIAEEQKVPLWLPTDVVAASDITESASSTVYTLEQGIPHDQKGLDEGPETLAMLRSKLSDAKTILWNGPVGVFEITQFAAGTNAIASMLADSAATTVVGGGDSLAAIHKAGLSSRITHLSTGGGATLELIEKGTLPALEVLNRSKSTII